MGRCRVLVVSGAIALLMTGALTSAGAVAQQLPGRERARPAMPRPSAPHGTPPGWKFTLPKGEPARGREAFVKFECHKCHEVKGQSFPQPADKENVGPELAAMAAHHEAEYFAESIINPNAVVEARYKAPDGSSRMPSFNDSLTVQDVVDLVAFIKSLASPGAAGGHEMRQPGHR